MSGKKLTWAFCFGPLEAGPIWKHPWACRGWMSNECEKEQNCGCRAMKLFHFKFGNGYAQDAEQINLSNDTRHSIGFLNFISLEKQFILHFGLFSLPLWVKYHVLIRVPEYCKDFAWYIRHQQSVVTYSYDVSI